MNIYEIDNEIMNCVDFETGEILDIEKLENLELERENKIENIALWKKNVQADAKAIREEEKALAERRRSLERRAISLEEYLRNILGGEKFETSKVKISWRKSKQLKIDESAKVPERFIKIEEKIQKAELKKAVQDGLEIEGIELVTNNNMQIK